MLTCMMLRTSQRALLRRTVCSFPLSVAVNTCAYFALQCIRKTNRWQLEPRSLFHTMYVIFSALYSQHLNCFHLNQSDINQVTAENLVVFSVRYKYVFISFPAVLLKESPGSTPWKRITSYDVPAAMPACPAGGCICAVSIFALYILIETLLILF